MFNEAWFSQSLHMSVAAFCATGFAVAGLHAYFLLKGKNREFHNKAFRISVIFGIFGAVLAPLSGDVAVGCIS